VLPSRRLTPRGSGRASITPFDDPLITLPESVITIPKSVITMPKSVITIPKSP
jgi:hypothetical protein